MMDYRERFKTLSLQQMQQLLAILCKGCWSYAPEVAMSVDTYLDFANGSVPPPDNRTWDQIYAGKQPTVTAGIGGCDSANGDAVTSEPAQSEAKCEWCKDKTTMILRCPSCKGTGRAKLGDDKAIPPTRLLFERIRLAWEKVPEQRLGQVICNALMPDSGSATAPLFYADDGAFVCAIEEYAKGYNQPRAKLASSDLYEGAKVVQEHASSEPRSPLSERLSPYCARVIVKAGKLIPGRRYRAHSSYGRAAGLVLTAVLPGNRHIGEITCVQTRGTDGFPDSWVATVKIGDEVSHVNVTSVEPLGGLNAPTDSNAVHAKQEAACECIACLQKLPPPTLGSNHPLNRMVLCSKCGNKRCPHANNHENECAGSNEPGQKGSAYEDQAASARPWDEGGRDEYFSKLPGDSGDADGQTGKRR